MILVVDSETIPVHSGSSSNVGSHLDVPSKPVKWPITFRSPETVFWELGGAADAECLKRITASPEGRGT
jgi:hypothetical protein